MSPFVTRCFFAGLTVASSQLAVLPVAAQCPATRDSALVTRRDSLEHALEAIATIERKVMVPMRDGARMATDMCRPKDAGKNELFWRGG